MVNEMIFWNGKVGLKYENTGFPRVIIRILS